MIVFIVLVVALTVMLALAYLFRSRGHKHPFKAIIRNILSSSAGAGVATVVMVLAAAAAIPGISIGSLSMWAIIAPAAAVIAGLVLARLLADKEDTYPWSGIIRKMSVGGIGTIIGSLVATLILLAVYGSVSDKSTK